MTDHHASCSCRQLRLVAHGEPVRVSMCHCYACQRRTGDNTFPPPRFSVWEERMHPWVGVPEGAERRA